MRLLLECSTNLADPDDIMPDGYEIEAGDALIHQIRSLATLCEMWGLESVRQICDGGEYGRFKLEPDCTFEPFSLSNLPDYTVLQRIEYRELVVTPQSFGFEARSASDEHSLGELITTEHMPISKLETDDD